ncbi:uncharacterized protein F4822DRAFT_427297 [Hypoxylon trugodes]|uniref:uncharacterized protein n=1 Tax=Hypoxylon trugodes TaxID=326681 RepID=UPI0021944093|nr:uncharacterized protein F4822DRAFT_427297 [Hypoxylon trugodes]KAI1391446.1 hypothetical protein F4822DRAFT_427297 [Hypoxylon trugodes]
MRFIEGLKTALVLTIVPFVVGALLRVALTKQHKPHMDKGFAQGAAGMLPEKPLVVQAQLNEQTTMQTKVKHPSAEVD